MIDVKQAVRMAKGEIIEIFAEEKIADLGLEEVRFDEENNTWRVTVGFSRPWSKATGPLAQFNAAIGQRDYKVVTLAAGDGHMIAIEERKLLEHG